MGSAALLLVVAPSCDEPANGADAGSTGVVAGTGTGSTSVASGSTTATASASSGSSSLDGTPLTSTVTDGTWGTEGTDETAGTGGTETDASGTEGEFDVECFAEWFPFGGSLVTAGAPPTIVLDEVVDDVAAERIDAPALVVDSSCEPITLIRGGMKGFGGLAMRQEFGRWVRVATPSSFRTGGVDYDATNEEIQVFLSEGLATTSWRYDGVAWSDALSVIGYRAVSSAGVAVTGDASARLAATDYMASIGIYGLDGGAWTNLDDFQVGSGPFGVALRGGPDALTASWRVPAGVDLQRTGVRRGGATEEEIAVVDGWFPGYDGLPATIQVPIEPALATDAEGVPLVLTVRDADAGRLETVLLRGDAAGWTTFAVAVDTGSPCVRQDYDEGEMCSYDYREVRPLSVVAGGSGEFLAFFSVADRVGTVLASSAGGPSWTDVDDQTQYSLHVAWLSGANIQTQEVLAQTRVHRMSSYVDDAGRVHLALNEGPVEASTVRYLRMDPGR